MFSREYVANMYFYFGKKMFQVKHVSFAFLASWGGFIIIALDSIGCVSLFFVHYVLLNFMFDAAITGINFNPIGSSIFAPILRISFGRKVIIQRRRKVFICKLLTRNYHTKVFMFVDWLVIRWCVYTSGQQYNSVYCCWTLIRQGFPSPFEIENTQKKTNHSACYTCLQTFIIIIILKSY